MEDGRGVQWLGVHLVAVVSKSYDDGVWVEYDLYILRLLNFTIQVGDGEGDVVIPAVGLEPRWDSFSFDAVAPLVQG